MARPKGIRNGQGFKTVCAYCNKKVSTGNRSRKYCSRKCFEVGRRTYTKCLVCEVEFWNKKKTTFCSRSCSAKSRPSPMLGKKFTPEHRKKIGDAIRGKRNWNWKGGVTPYQKQERRKPEYVAWRKAVFERDNFTCQVCSKRGGVLQADHIKSWIKYPELRTELSNGRTLCIDCHKATPTYARNKDYQP